MERPSQASSSLLAEQSTAGGADRGGSAATLVAHAQGAAAAAREVRAAAEQAATMLKRYRAEVFGREQTETAMRVVLDGLSALETVLRRSAPGSDLAWSTDAEADHEPPPRDLAARLARLDHDAMPDTLVEDATELLLAGLRSASLANDIERALPFGRAALALASHHGRSTQAAQAHSDLASMYGRRDFTERAIEHLSAAIGVLEAAGEPVTPTLINNLGNVYVSNDRLDEALGCFERAAAAYGELGDISGRAIALANQGRALVGQRRFREAAAALVQALAIFRSLARKPYIAATLAKLGSCYSRLGEFDAARGWFEAAVVELGEAAPAFGEEVHEAYGRALLEMGRPAEALAHLEKAERYAQRDGIDMFVVDLLKLQAGALAALGRHEDAYLRLSRYLERSAEQQGVRGETLLSVMLVELESGLAADHELPALTSRVLTEANRALRLQAERLERISTTDDLTQQFNRRYLNQRLVEELRRTRGRGSELSLILFDVDHFKAINDRHSHLVGDEVLRQVAMILRATFRHNDVVARWGGEEFAVLLPDTAQAAAEMVAEKARAAVAAGDWSAIGAGLRVTVSAGVAAAAEVGGAEGGPALLKLADSRLYQAKKAGRNRIAAG